jgi:hypothetical protein
VDVIRFDEKAFDALSKKCKNYYFFSILFIGIVLHCQFGHLMVFDFGYERAISCRSWSISLMERVGFFAQ